MTRKKSKKYLNHKYYYNPKNHSELLRKRHNRYVMKKVQAEKMKELNKLVDKLYITDDKA